MAWPRVAGHRDGDELETEHGLSGTGRIGCVLQKLGVRGRKPRGRVRQTDTQHQSSLNPSVCLLIQYFS